MSKVSILLFTVRPCVDNTAGDAIDMCASMYVIINNLFLLVKKQATFLHLPSNFRRDLSSAIRGVFLVVVLMVDSKFL
jgi:hypothetical protein